MSSYYIAMVSKSHAFLLEKRIKKEGIYCEISYLPRSISSDLCGMGVKLDEANFQKAVEVIKRTGFPGLKIYKEEIRSNDNKYLEVKI